MTMMLRRLLAVAAMLATLASTAAAQEKPAARPAADRGAPLLVIDHVSAESPGGRVRVQRTPRTPSSASAMR